MQHEPLHICPACGAVFLRRKKAFAFVADLNGGTAAKELSKEMIERRPMPMRKEDKLLQNRIEEATSRIEDRISTLSD